MAQPTTIHADGTREWKNVEGKRHRLDGPAIEWATGSRNWFVNGVAHREDGPAYEDVTGYCEWWIQGNMMLKEWRVDGILSRQEFPKPTPSMAQRRFAETLRVSRAEREWQKQPKEGWMIGETCVVTLEEITADSEVAKCGVCSHLVAFLPILEWFQTNQHRECPHCRSKWTNFVKYM